MNPLGAFLTAKGRLKVREFEAPLWLTSGATTEISAKSRNASTKASIPGAV